MDQVRRYHRLSTMHARNTKFMLRPHVAYVGLQRNTLVARSTRITRTVLSITRAIICCLLRSDMSRV